MKKFFYILLYLFLIIGSSFGADLDSTTDINDTKITESSDLYFVKPVDSTLLLDLDLAPQEKHSPSKAVLFSTFVPGSGQFYCGRKSRGIVFLLSDAAIGGFALYNRRKWHRLIVEYQNILPKIDLYKDSLFHFKLIGDAVNTQKYFIEYKNTYNEYYMKKYEALEVKYKYHAFVGWGIGIYLTNIMDGLASSKYFYSEKHKNSGLAAGLSAIPILGLGQIYNTSFQKAGLLWTTEFMLLYMAINNGRLAETANRKKNEIAKDLSLSDKEMEDFTLIWTNKYDASLKDRNRYLWYFVLFYFYGIFDAAVDAHLHDKALKIRLHPLVDPVEKSASLNLSLNIRVKNKNGNYTKRYR